MKILSLFTRSKERIAGKPASEVILYTRQGCHLCDEAKRLLHKLQREQPFELKVIDVDTDPQLRVAYNEDVPVIYINGRKAFKHRIEPGKFLKSIRADLK